MATILLAPYYSSYGPARGPILAVERVPTMGLYDRLDGSPMPVGMAWCAGVVEHPRGAVQVFRLTAHKEDLPDLYVCVSRQFVLLEDWEEREAIRYADLSSS